MKITRVGDPPTSNFTMMPNALLRDDRLTRQDIGLMALLLSHQDGWDFDVTTSRDSTRASMHRLEECGYIMRVRNCVPDGTYAWSVLVTLTPSTGFQSVDAEPGTGYPLAASPSILRRTKPKKTKKELSTEKGKSPSKPVTGNQSVGRKKLRKDRKPPLSAEKERHPKKTPNGKKILKLVRNAEGGMFTSQIASSLGKASIELIGELRDMESSGMLTNVANKGMVEKWKEVG